MTIGFAPAVLPPSSSTVLNDFSSQTSSNTTVLTSPSMKYSQPNISKSTSCVTTTTTSDTHTVITSSHINGVKHSTTSGGTVSSIMEQDFSTIRVPKGMFVHYYVNVVEC